MGLIKAAMGAASGVMGDQWKEYFYCDALPAEVLAVKGQKRTNGRSANRHGSENVISDGSVIAVADGQCVLIVEQGKVVDLCAEPGEYTYSTGTQPSLLSSGLKNIDSVFAELGKRFSFGGQAGSDQFFPEYQLPDQTCAFPVLLLSVPALFHFFQEALSLRQSLFSDFLL